MICGFILCASLLFQFYAEAVRPGNYITVLYEGGDSIVLPLVQNFNVSYLFYKEEYGLDDEINLERFDIPLNGTAKLLEKVSESYFVVSLSKNPDTLQVLQDVSREKNIPIIQYQLHPWTGFYNVTESPHSDTSNPVSNETEPGIPDNFAVIVPSYIVLDNMLDEFVTSMNITEELTILYDEQYEKTVEYDWRKPYEALPVSVRYEMTVEEDGAIRKQLENLGSRASTIFFVGATSTVEKYTQLAAPQIKSKRWTWVVFTKDTLPFKCIECLEVDLYWVRIMSSGKFENIRRLAEYLRQEELDVDMNYAIKSYNEPKISTCMDIMSMAFEYIVGTNKTLREIVQKKRPDMLRKGKEEIETNSTVQALLDREKPYEFGPYEYHYLYYYYQVTTAMIFKLDRKENERNTDYNKYIGNWTLTDGITTVYDSLGIDVRKLNHFRVVTIIQEPFIQIATDPETGETHFEGYCIDLMELIQQDLGFTYEIYLVEDGKFGSVDDNGNWNGCIGELVVGKAEIALGPISVMAERENDIDFTVPYYDLVGTTILMKRNEVEYSLFKFLKVLEWPVWLCILGAYLFTSILLWIFDRFSPYSYRNNKEKYANDTEKREFTLKECLWFCMTSLTPQGGGEAPKNVSGRLVAATWWLFGFIIIASYTANLAAFLTVSRIEQQITSLDDLAKQYKTAYAPMKGGGTETYFRRMAEIEEQFYNIWKQMSLNESMNSRDRAKLAVWDYPVSDKYTNMWRFMQESKLPNSIDEAIQRVLESPDGKGFAFIGDAMEIKYAQLTNCKLQMIGTEFSRKPYAIAVQSGHPMKDKISQTILKLLNQRSLEQLKEKWWHQNPKRQECPNAEDDSTGISIQNIGGVFIVILAGIVISLIILVFEYFYYKKKDAAAQKEVGNGKVTTGNSEQNHHHSFMITTPDDEPENVVRSRRNPHNGTNGDEPAARNGGVFHYQNSAFEF